MQCELPLVHRCRLYAVVLARPSLCTVSTFAFESKQRQHEQRAAGEESGMIHAADDVAELTSLCIGSDHLYCTPFYRREHDKTQIYFDQGNLDERVTDALVWELMLQAGPVGGSPELCPRESCLKAVQQRMFIYREIGFPCRIKALGFVNFSYQKTPSMRVRS